MNIITLIPCHFLLKPLSENRECMISNTIYHITFPPSPSFIPSFEAKYTADSEKDLTGMRRARRTSRAPGRLSDSIWTLEPDIPVSHTQT